MQLPSRNAVLIRNCLHLLFKFEMVSLVSVHDGLKCRKGPHAGNAEIRQQQFTKINLELRKSTLGLGQFSICAAPHSVSLFLQSRKLLLDVRGQILRRVYIRPGERCSIRRWLDFIVFARCTCSGADASRLLPDSRGQIPCRVCITRMCTLS